MIALFITVCLFSLARSSGDDWSYAGDNGPSHWKGDCMKNAQSPINIKTSDVEFEPALTKPKLLKGYDVNIITNLTNNGHSVSVGLPDGIEMSLPTVKGTYRAAAFHFHWGTDKMKGSEHLVDSKSYPMELHVVHFNTKYSSVQESLSHSDGLAVLGFFFEEKNDDNDKYLAITEELKSPLQKGDIRTVRNFKLKDLMLPEEDLGSYFRYEGSLTTPPCSQVITWTVFSKPIPIGSKQMSLFRNNVKLADNMKNNFRPPLPLNRRDLFTGDESLLNSASSVASSALIFIVFSLSLL